MDEAKPVSSRDANASLDGNPTASIDVLEASRVAEWLMGPTPSGGGRARVARR